MIGTVTFDGLSQGALWNDLSVELAGALDGIVGLDAAPKRRRHAGPAARRRAGRRVLPARDRRRALGRRRASTPRELRRAFIHTLVPIALVYVAAHYLTLLLFEGQATFYLASDPLGRGWDLFGTASRAIDYTYISQNAIWYMQVAFVVAGHVAALILAHDRALALYRDPQAGRPLAVLDARR